MLPVSSAALLTMDRIADYWSREIKPQMSKGEVYDALVKAWWRGEFAEAFGPRRCDLVRALYATRGSGPIFVVHGRETQPSITMLEGGGAQVDLSPHIPLPNSLPDSWTDDLCTDAFNAIAASWNERAFAVIAPSVLSVGLDSRSFFQWTALQGYPRPTFWRREPQTTPTSSPAEVERLVQSYLCESGSKATIDGAVKFVRDAGFRGGRDSIRSLARKGMELRGVEIRRGRRPNSAGK
jgi:hypothetical protein